MPKEGSRVWPKKPKSRLSLSLARPIIWVVLVLLVFGSLFGGFKFAPQAKEAYAASTYYVSTSGTDDASHGTGTGTNAWATLSYALTGARISAGDTLKVEAGTYDAFYGVNTSIRPYFNTAPGYNTVTVEPYVSGSQITFNIPSNTDTGSAFLFMYSGYWTDLKFKNINFTNTHSVNTTLAWIYGHNLAFEDCNISMNNVAGATVRIGNDTESSSLTLKRSVIKDSVAATATINNLRTDGGTVNILAQGNLMYNQNALIFNLTKPTNLTLQNNTIVNKGSYTVYVIASGSNVVAKNNIFYTDSAGDYYPFRISSGDSAYQYILDHPESWDITNNIWYRASGYLPMIYSYDPANLIPIDGTNHFFDPLFADKTSYNFAIQSGSHNRGLGSQTDLPSGGDIVGEDWIGNDIGAYKSPSSSIGVSLQDKVAFVGDSIMTGSGYNPNCFTYFNTQTGVSYVSSANAAISGARMDRIFAHIDTVMIDDSPDTIFLSVGINDMAIHYSDDAQAYTNYLLQLMKKIQVWGATPIWLGLGSLNGYGSLPDTTLLGVNIAMATGCATNGYTCGNYLDQMKLNSNWQTDYYQESGNVHPNGAGQVIIGKIAEYLYYNKGTIGTNGIDTAAGARVYADGKFRNKATASGTTANLSIAPTGGFGSGDYSQWMDITSMTWNNTGTHHKAWTESSAVSGLTNTIHTVGDLEANKYYNVKVDDALGSNITGTNCASGICKSDSSGKITFTYTGTYSNHTFDVEAGDNTPPTISSLSSSPSSATTDITWNTSEAASSQVEYGLTSGYGSSTTETDINPRVTSHTVSLSGLSPCTTYYYRAHSKDALSNESISEAGVFTTTGCLAPLTASASKSSYRSYLSNITTVADTNTTIPKSGTSGSLITFDATDLFPGQDIIKYAWDFGDGTTSEGQTIDHTYASPGRYTVTITGYDKNNKPTIITDTIDVVPQTPTIDNVTSDGTDLLITGTAYQNDTVYLTIHSDPLNDQTKADSDGRWEYRLATASEVIGEGTHTVSAIDAFKLADNTELKSEATKDTKFSITVDDGKLKVEMEKTRNWRTTALILTAIIIVLVGGWLVVRRRKV